MEKLISIIVPVFNIEKYVEPCILSLINQTYSNFEIIIVDDGSTDNSGQICDNIAISNEKIKVHKMLIYAFKDMFQGRIKMIL